jgi:hypothetical protein
VFRNWARDAKNEATRRNDGGVAKKLIDDVVLRVLGTAKADYWNADIGFVKSFDMWAGNRDFIKTRIKLDEDPEWKKKFDEFDESVRAEHERNMERVKYSGINDAEKSKEYFLLSQRLAFMGYVKEQAPREGEKHGER